MNWLRKVLDFLNGEAINRSIREQIKAAEESYLFGFRQGCRFGLPEHIPSSKAIGESYMRGCIVGAILRLQKRNREVR